MSILNYFEKMKALVDEVFIIRRPLDDQDLIILILGGPNPRFDPCIYSISR